MADESVKTEFENVQGEDTREPYSAVHIENIKPTFKVHNFAEHLSDQFVNFHVLKMVDSLFIWVGVKPEMSSLAVAANTTFDSIPSVISLLGSCMDITSKNLAQKLAKTTGKQCFVSCNIPASENNILMAQVEARISKERKLHPEKF